jgi:ATP adenylyltransferase
MYRSRQKTKAYHKDPKHNLTVSDTVNCPFCVLDKRKVDAETATMRVVANRFPYQYWDSRNVTEHLLLTPKRHVLSLSELRDDEKVEAINLMAEYESNGYSVYWRSQTNDSRSVPHQHTHLFKLGEKQVSLLFYVRRPYYFLTLWKKLPRP